MNRILSRLMILVMLALSLSGIALAEEAGPRPILLQGAMDIETTTMMEALENAKEETVAGYKFVTGTLDGYPVIVSKTQVGMVNAAATTAAAIMTWDPIAVVNQGTAGGHDLALHAGDIVIGASTVNINSFRSEWADVGTGINAAGWEFRSTEVLKDGQFQGVFELPSDPALMDLAMSVKDKYETGNVALGVIGSGDVWNKELDRIALIHEKFNTACEEMETFAVAQVCHQFEVPFLGVRILSNNELHKEDFDPATGPACQEFTLIVARAMIASYQAN